MWELGVNESQTSVFGCTIGSIPGSVNFYSLLPSHLSRYVSPIQTAWALCNFLCRHICQAIIPTSFRVLCVCMCVCCSSCSFCVCVCMCMCVVLAAAFAPKRIFFFLISPLHLILKQCFKCLVFIGFLFACLFFVMPEAGGHFWTTAVIPDP